jgi:predicted outer membrane repeat protein
MRMKVLCFLLVCTIAVLFSPAVYGQATGSFSGNVVDKSGSAISGATVTVTSQTTGASRKPKPTKSAIISFLSSPSPSTPSASNSPAFKP